MKKIVFYALCVGLYLVANVAGAQQSAEKKMVAGSWIGKLNAGAIPIRIVFNLTLNEKDSLLATLDSPDQGVKGIKIGPVIINGNDLTIQAPLLMGIYNGSIKNDTLITGTWKQGGQTMALDLSKLKAPFSINRPQEPKPPFPYTEKDVTFSNEKAGIILAGTLTIPQGDGPFPAVVLITGSGAQNRNEELMGHKPFMVIADWLARNGIAVLRYDDRGVGKSKGDYIAATTADLATDAASAAAFLKNNPLVKTSLIGLAGHSEGGIIAPLVASENSTIDFIISLAGTGIPGDRIIFKQSEDINRASGLDEKQIRESVKANKKLFPILKKEPDNKAASEKMITAYTALVQKSKVPQEEKDKALGQVRSSFNPVTLTWLRYFISTDPAQFWKKVKCPVLAINGEKDLQVSADINLVAIEKALKSGGNDAVTVRKMPGLNHLFQHCRTGLPSEYANIEETFSPEVLTIMSDWISALK